MPQAENVVHLFGARLPVVHRHVGQMGDSGRVDGDCGNLPCAYRFDDGMVVGEAMNHHAVDQPAQDRRLYRVVAITPLRVDG